MCYFRKGRRDRATELSSSASRNATEASPAADVQGADADSMITVKVLTVEGEPTFEVPLGTSNEEIKRMVERRYGWRGVGMRHSYVGLTGKGARK